MTDAELANMRFLATKHDEYKVARISASYLTNAADEITRLRAEVERLKVELSQERERCAKIAENYSNAQPGDICEVMAGDWQHGIAEAIRSAALAAGGNGE